MNENSKGFNYKYTKRELLENSISRQWIETQSNVQNAIRFLIEKYAYENGIYDIGKVIPSVRDEAYFKALASNSTKPNQNNNKPIESSRNAEHPHDYPFETKAGSSEGASNITTISKLNINIRPLAEQDTSIPQESDFSDEVPDCYK